MIRKGTGARRLLGFRLIEYPQENDPRKLRDVVHRPRAVRAPHDAAYTLESSELAVTCFFAAVFLAVFAGTGGNDAERKRLRKEKRVAHGLLLERMLQVPHLQRKVLEGFTARAAIAIRRSRATSSFPFIWTVIVVTFVP